MLTQLGSGFCPTFSMFCLNGDIVMDLLLFSTHRFLFLSFSLIFFSCFSHFISHVKPVLFTPFSFLHCPSFAFVFNFISSFLIFLVTVSFLLICPLASIFLSFQILSLHRYCSPASHTSPLQISHQVVAVLTVLKLDPPVAPA